MKLDANQLIRHVFTGKIPLKKLLNVDPNQLDSLFSTGYQYYQSGLYEKALAYFHLLLYIDPKNPNYSLALAMVLHRTGEYKRAGLAYIVASMNDKENPFPWFHLADCHMQLKDPQAAFDALITLQELESTHPEFEELKKRAKLLTDNLAKSGILKEEDESYG